MGSTVPEAAGRATSRRRLIKAGLVVGVPMMLTLRGRQAWAQEATGSALGSPFYPPVGGNAAAQPQPASPDTGGRLA